MTQISQGNDDRERPKPKEESGLALPSSCLLGGGDWELGNGAIIDQTHNMPIQFGNWAWAGAATGPGETLTGAIWTIYIRTKWNAEFTGKAPYTDVIQVLGQPGFKGCRF